MDVPSILVGSLLKVRQQWNRTIIDSIKANNDWDVTFNQMRLISLVDTKEPIFIVSPHPSTESAMVGFHAHQVFNGLWEATQYGLADLVANENRREWYQRLKLSVNAGLSHLWFCVGMLGAGSLWFPQQSGWESEKREMAIAILAALMTWWPQICSLESIYVMGNIQRGWPSWARVLGTLCEDADICARREIFQVSASAAGQKLVAFLEENDVG
jgi:hypothetical protein